MAGFKVVPVKALADGSLDLPDLKEKAQKHNDRLAAFMVCGPLLSLYDFVSHYQGYLSLHFWRLRGRHFGSMQDRSCQWWSGLPRRYSPFTLVLIRAYSYS
jgi:hypothetical protein